MSKSIKKGEIMIERAGEITSFWAYENNPRTNQGLVLLDNVQFIYELALAQLELKSLGAEYRITNGMREFELIRARNEENLINRLAYFKYVKERQTCYFQIIQKNRTRSVNQYLTHWIYPYKGKFHPQMIRSLINIIGLEPGNIVVDPFIGSGTTALEAQLLGIDCVGIDISPLCVLQSKVKTESIFELDSILNCRDMVEDTIKSTLFDVSRAKLDEIIESIPNDNTRNFFKMAKLVAISDNARRGRDFNSAFLRNIDLMINSVSDYKKIQELLTLKLGRVTIMQADARRIPLEDNKADGIITSPPYSIALDYVANDAHALRELSFDPDQIKDDFIGVRGKSQNKIDLYNEDMKLCLQEMYRILKPNKYAVIVIGNASYLGKEVNTVEFIKNFAEKIGFELVKDINKIIFGLYNVMQKENILIFKKK